MYPAKVTALSHVVAAKVYIFLTKKLKVRGGEREREREREGWSDMCLAVAD